MQVFCWPLPFFRIFLKCLSHLCFLNTLQQKQRIRRASCSSKLDLLRFHLNFSFKKASFLTCWSWLRFRPYSVSVSGRFEATDPAASTNIPAETLVFYHDLREATSLGSFYKQQTVIPLESTPLSGREYCIYASVYMLWSLASFSFPLFLLLFPFSFPDWGAQMS